MKFYTDLWHSLLGRHKLDDYNGEYPDYTDGTRVGAQTKNIRFHVRQLAKDREGKVKHHMYNSDAFWLTQWNLNTLWGLAYPSVLDDFAASLLEYDVNGNLLPRGPCAGGYSYIMMSGNFTYHECFPKRTDQEVGSAKSVQGDETESFQRRNAGLGNG